jgi:hypothetical protein
MRTLAFYASSALLAWGCSSTETEASKPVSAPEPSAVEAVDEVEAPPVVEEPPPRDFPYELIEGEPMYTVVPRDGIPAIDAPVFVSVAVAATFMQDDETVLGVVGRDGTTKCYSAWQLDSHEIVNDVLDGLPIAATW